MEVITDTLALIDELEPRLNGLSLPAFDEILRDGLTTFYNEIQTCDWYVLRANPRTDHISSNGARLYVNALLLRYGCNS